MLGRFYKLIIVLFQYDFTTCGGLLFVLTITLMFFGLFAAILVPTGRIGVSDSSKFYQIILLSFFQIQLKPSSNYHIKYDYMKCLDT